MYVFPVWVLTPTVQRTYLVGNTLQGPIAADGVSMQTTRTDGGGLWRIDCEFEIRNRDQIRCARAWSAYLDGGTTEFIMPVVDLRFAPRPMIGGQLQQPGVPAMPADWFATEVGYGSSLVRATVIADAALRATSLSFTMDQGSSPVGGEHFSIEYDDIGHRMHRLVKVTLESDTSESIVATIRPPLRGAINAGTAEPQMNFDMPCVVAKLHPDTADALDAAVSQLRLGDTVRASFIESFVSP